MIIKLLGGLMLILSSCHQHDRTEAGIIKIPTANTKYVSEAEATIFCIEDHIYYYFDRGIAPKLTDDGKPVKC